MFFRFHLEKKMPVSRFLKTRHFRLEILENRTMLAVSAGMPDQMIFFSEPEEAAAVGTVTAADTITDEAVVSLCESVDQTAGNEVLPTYSEAPSTIVTTAFDKVDSSDGLISLREAIAYGGDECIVTFSSSLNGGTIKLTDGEITINSIVTIDASELDLGVTINGNGGRIFVNQDTLELKNLELTNGSAITGGAVINYQALLMTDCSVTNCTAGMTGGGLYNWEGITELIRCSFICNDAVNGGAIWNANGEIYAVDSEFSMNYAYDEGGALGNGYGRVTISNSLVTDNIAEGYYGGGFYNMGELTLYNCTAANNTSGQYGGGVFNSGEKALLWSHNSIIAMNSAEIGGNDIYNWTSSESVYGYYSLSSFTEWERNYNSLIYSPSEELFVSSETGDYRLVSTAQAVDTGNNDYAEDPYGFPLATDFDGNIRIANGRVDMGAYEYGSVDPSELVAVIGYEGTYDGEAHGLTLVGTLETDTILYSSDGENFSSGPITFTNAGSYEVFVWITREGSFSYQKSGSVVITKRLISVSIDPDDKVYDGTVAADGSYTLHNVCAGDTVSLSGGYYVFNNRNAGADKKVTFRGYSIGTGSSNYQLANTTASGIADVIQKQLTVSGTEVSNKRYDGTAEAEVTVGTVSGICANDSVSVTASGTFSSAEPGVHNVTVCYDVAGTAAPNYIAPPSEILTAEITSGSPVDIDGDGFIGPGDYAILSAHWFAAKGDEAWDTSCDIDHDGFIGPGDLSYISANWFKTIDDPGFIDPPSALISSDEDSTVCENNTVSELDLSPVVSSSESSVTFTLTASAEPTENLTVLKTGASNFGTFYYVDKDSIPSTNRDDIVDLEEYYLELWVSDTTGTGEFVSCLQFQLNYDPNTVISVSLEDLYGGKIAVDSYEYYDSSKTCIKAVQVGWLFSSGAKWDLMAPLTNGENAWLLARFVVTVDIDSSSFTPSFAVSGVTNPVSPFVSGFYYVHSGEYEPIDDSLIKTIGVPSYTRLWKHSPDINRDQLIDPSDWSYISDAWHTSPGNESWNELCDINGDNYIDDADLAWLTENWLSVWNME